MTVEDANLCNALPVSEDVTEVSSVAVEIFRSRVYFLKTNNELKWSNGFERKWNMFSNECYVKFC